jgi:hypothetical protein
VFPYPTNGLGPGTASHLLGLDKTPYCKKLTGIGLEIHVDVDEDTRVASLVSSRELNGGRGGGSTTCNCHLVASHVESAGNVGRLSISVCYFLTGRLPNCQRSGEQ